MTVNWSQMLCFPCRLGQSSLKELDDGPELDVAKAKLLARLTSVAYCSDADIIRSWQCTRCRRVDGFKPHDVRGPCARLAYAMS